jgi:hypothetical protein
MMKTTLPEISVGLALRGGVILLGCMLGVDALANLGTLDFSRFEVGELAAAVVIVIALVPSSLWLRAGGTVVVAAAVVGVARTGIVVTNALLEHRHIPIERDAYVV